MQLVEVPPAGHLATDRASLGTLPEAAAPGRWAERLDSFAGLGKGWDSYRAEPPAPEVLRAAGDFLKAAESAGREPAKLNPSVVGGVGFTFRSGARTAYVEFRNTGNAHAAFIDGEAEPEVVKVVQDGAGYAAVLERIASFTDGQTSRGDEN